MKNRSAHARSQKCVTTINSLGVSDHGRNPLLGMLRVGKNDRQTSDWLVSNWTDVNLGGLLNDPDLSGSFRHASATVLSVWTWSSHTLSVPDVPASPLIDRLARNCAITISRQLELECEMTRAGRRHVDIDARGHRVSETSPSGNS